MDAQRLSILVLVLVCTSAAAVAVEPIRPCTRPGYLSGIPWAEYQYRPRSPSQTAVSRRGIMLRTKTTVQPVALSSQVRREYRDEQVLRYLPNAADRLIERQIDETIVGGRHQTDDLPLPGRVALDRESLQELQPGVTRRVLTDNFTTQRPAAEPEESVVVELYQLYTPSLKIGHCEISQVALQLHDDGHWILSLRADQNRRPEEGDAVVYNPQLHIKRNQFHVRLRCLGAFKDEPGAAALAVGRPVLADLEPCAFWVQNGQPRYVRTGDWDAWIQEHFEDIDRIEVEFFYYAHHSSLSPLRTP